MTLRMVWDQRPPLVAGGGCRRDDIRSDQPLRNQKSLRGMSALRLAALYSIRLERGAIHLLVRCDELESVETYPD